MGPDASEFFIIAGLGNPGRKYDNTRHNVGFGTVDLLSQRHGIKVSRLKHKALVGDGTIKNKKVLLVKPQTFMNLSGESIRDLMEWFKIPMEKLILIYDDADLPLGKVRVRPSGSSGTHNGMKSVIFQLQKDDFPRIRIGIDKAPEGWDLADYVLARFNSEEGKIIGAGISNAADAAEAIVISGVNTAMNRYNGI
ncbi:MAG: aminoacyl-tRNA hydrolase [Ruminiclostridium sp.]|nr:aminoacyl-tRNA hydrolase [Ruminiclostridium sp.]